MGHAVFISYARKTSLQYARSLHVALGHGSAFLDMSDIEFDNRFPEDIADALLSARVAVVFADETYFGRWYCQRELQVALAPFDLLVRRRGDSGSQQHAPLGHIVVALPPEGAAAASLQHLPPQLRTRNLPRADDCASLAQLVNERLATVVSTIGEDLGAEADSVRARLLAEASLPTPQNLAQLQHRSVDAMPSSLRDGFVGRANDLWRIHFHLTTLRGETSVAALSGSIEGGGGFGKTRLAAEYVHRHALDYPGGVFWLALNANLDDGDRTKLGEQLERPFFQILRALRPNTPALAEFKAQGRVVRDDLAKALGEVASKLRVLYVVDNIPEPSPGRPPLPLTTWCPCLDGVTLLTTSRARHNGGDGVRCFPVDVLAPEDAVSLLTREVQLNGTSDKMESWYRIAAWVGYLPLALELLNRALVFGATTRDELLERVQSAGTTRVLDLQAAVLRAHVPAGALRGVTEAFKISYDQLTAEEQTLACMLAQLSSTPIPLELVNRFAQECCAQDQQKIASARVTLQMRSLVTQTSGGEVEMFGRMHRVLADFLRVQAKNPNECRASVVDAICEVFPAPRFTDEAFSATHGALAASLLPHVTTVLAHTSHAAPSSHETMLMNQVGVYFISNGPLASAEDILRKALASDTARPDRDSRTVAIRQINLAVVFRLTSRFREAEQLLQAALAELDEETHASHRACAYSNLMEIQRITNRLNEAEKSAREALRLDRRLLEPHDPKIAMDLHNLASITQEIVASDLSESERLLREAIEINSSAFGKRSAQVASDNHLLGLVLGKQGFRDQAKQRLRSAQTINEEIFGHNHWSVAKNLIALAHICLGQRVAAPEFWEAEAPIRRALQIFETCQLFDSHEAAQAHSTLSTILMMTSRPSEAKVHLKEALRVLQPMFGSEHRLVKYVHQRLEILQRGHT